MGKKKFSIIANCQGGALIMFLNSNKYFLENYELIRLNPIQNVTKKEIDKFYETMHLLDLIIMQPISDNFKNYHKYSTKSILANIKKECVVIMFPSLYYNVYFPNLIRDVEMDKSININVHDKNVIKKFINSENKQTFVNECIDMINDLNFYSEEFVINNIKTSINNLLKKELDAINKYDLHKYELQYFIKVSPFISSHYKENILSVTFNHHTKYIYRYLSNEILNILGINITPYPEKLDPQINFESCIIYESVKNVINKEFQKNKYSQRELPNVDLITYLEFHYDKYSLVKRYLIEKYS